MYGVADRMKQTQDRVKDGFYYDVNEYLFSLTDGKHDG